MNHSDDGDDDDGEYILVKVGRVALRVNNLFLEVERVMKRRLVRPRILDLDRLTIIQVDSEEFQTGDSIDLRSTITIYSEKHGVSRYQP